MGRFSVSSRFFISIVSVVTVPGVLALAVTTASAQSAPAAQSAAPARPPAAQSRKAPPKPKPHGAWWYTGDAPPATPGPPDLTGVWYGRTSADISKDAIPGKEMVLTPYGKMRYDSVDHAKDPNTYCL